MDTTVLKCPGCGSSLPYNAEKGLWVCETCGAEFSEEEILKMTEAKSDADIDINKSDYKEDTTPDPDQPQLNLYRCQNCGAEMVTDENTASTFCVYCGSTGILKSRLEGKFRPKYVIPFSTTKQQAIAAYNGLRKKRFLAPKEFGQRENIEKITGVYIPFWLYDGQSEGYIDGERHELAKTWREGDYKCSQTNVYHEYREGMESFERVPADGSEKFDDNLMDSIEPFKFEALVPFNYSYLSGFLAEKYDVSAEDNEDRANLRMNNSLKQSLTSTINGVLVSSKEDINCKIENVDYVLLPVWMLNTFVKGKPYSFAMNGQTGKIVGDIPISKGKSALFFLILFALGFGIAALFAILFD